MKEIIKVFNEYVKKFDLKEKSLIRKFHHSYRVMEFSMKIAESLNLNEEDVKLASIVGLLHDIGRFEQWTKYKTFSDQKSIDHGTLACEILKNEILNQLNLSEEGKNIILMATYNHNKFEIESNVKDRELLMCKIIRDADKLDIMKEQIQPLDKNYAINQSIFKCILNQQLISIHLVKTPLDYLFLKLSFVYDLHFKYSFEFLLDKNIITNGIHILELYSNTNQKELEFNLKKYVKERLSC